MRARASSEAPIVSTRFNSVGRSKRVGISACLACAKIFATFPADSSSFRWAASCFSKKRRESATRSRSDSSDASAQRNTFDDHLAWLDVGFTLLATRSNANRPAFEGGVGVHRKRLTSGPAYDNCVSLAFLES